MLFLALKKVQIFEITPPLALTTWWGELPGGLKTQRSDIENSSNDKVSSQDNLNRKV